MARVRRRRANRGTRGTIRRFNRNVNRASKLAGRLLDQGDILGSRIVPEVFPGGEGLDRVTPGTVTAGQVSAGTITPGSLDFNRLNKFLAPSVNEAKYFANDTRTKFDELINLRKQKLGGLDAAENQALKESLFRDIDRQRSGAMRDAARAGARGLGAGASFAQRRALGRDYGDAAIGANRQLLLDNVNIKRQALNDLEGTTGARTNAISGALDKLSNLRAGQANLAGDVGRFNIQNQLAADQTNVANQLAANQSNVQNSMLANQFNVQNQLNADQFNAGQQATELGSRVGAVNAGIGLTEAQIAQLEADRKLQKMLSFIKSSEEDNFNRLQGIL